jgi:hypothetical protein
MNGVYWVVKIKETGKTLNPPGVSTAPHLYLTKGKANGTFKRLYRPELYEVVPVQLTELIEGA